MTQPVFVHSSFRTSSTWLWQIFRDMPGVCAYYEIFHEHLATLTTDLLQSIRPDAWGSNHPGGTRPYFLEFEALLNAEGGVPLSESSMAFERFIPARGVQAALSDGERAYVEGLIRAAMAHRQHPVLTCTRTLGRLGGLKQAFGGSHILIRRNLVHQWLSYCSLSANGQHYFLRTTHLIVNNNLHDPFIAALAAALLPPSRHLDDPLAAVPPADRDAFLLFFGLHLYLYLSATPAADVVVDVNRLARTPSYRRQIERAIATTTGLELDLSSVRERVEYPEWDMGDLGTLCEELERWLALAIDHLSATVDPVAARHLGARLIDEAIDELHNALLYGRAARARYDTLCASLHAQLAGQADALAHAEQERLSALQERDAVLASTSWKLTAPVRSLVSLARARPPRRS